MSEGKLPEWLTEEDDGSMTVSFADLKNKPKLDGTEVSSLTMREPTVADELAIEKIKSIGERESQAIANLTEQSPETIRGLTMRQYGRLQDAYGVFLG
ncbi:phage tail assembly protein [uncultured Ruegeria sp.]|uniref:phage tail assembly protein n=1 Tax=uncultured Ruegeria sp. TaxID=259304 RepID=UPI00263964E6|nr:phage tail assembly protein [uncultured Ruegeria sp.]